MSSADRGPAGKLTGGPGPCLLPSLPPHQRPQEARGAQAPATPAGFVSQAAGGAAGPQASLADHRASSQEGRWGQRIWVSAFSQEDLVHRLGATGAC